jgi:hypothetical protein
MHKKSLINIIFGIGSGLIFTSQSYPNRENKGDYLENQYNEYHDNRNYMMGGYGMNGMGEMSSSNMGYGQQHIGPLYHYMQSHQTGYMYGNHNGNNSRRGY